MALDWFDLASKVFQTGDRTAASVVSSLKKLDLGLFVSRLQGEVGLSICRLYRLVSHPQWAWREGSSFANIQDLTRDLWP